MDRVKIKETAKALLKKNHWLCVGLSLIMCFLGGLTTVPMPTFSFTYSIPMADASFSEETILFVIMGFITTIFTTAFSFAIMAFLGSQIKAGGCRFFLKYRKNHPVEIGELFKSYQDGTWSNIAKVSFFKNLEIFLWSMLCGIPGIIKTYEYFAVDYIMALNPTMDNKRAREMSKKIMYGHKMELFELYISFYGWHLLSIFTCGLLSFLYIVPYQLVAEAEFFAYVRENAIFNGVISYNDLPDFEQYNHFAYGQPGFDQTSYGQAPYGQTPYGQAPYGQAPYGQTPYGQAPYGQQPYAQPNYYQPNYGQPQQTAYTPYQQPTQPFAQQSPAQPVNYAPVAEAPTEAGATEAVEEPPSSETTEETNE